MPETAEKQKVEQIITDLISGVNESVLATVDNDRPWARFIMTYNIKGTFKLQSSTSINSRKVRQIQANPNIHITLGKADSNHIPYIQYAGKAKILTDEATKKAHWHKELEQYFGTADNPHYCVMEFEPEIIEVWGAEGDMSKPLCWKA